MQARDLPFIDFTDEQIVELADDSGAPVRDFWPCVGGGCQPCASCDGCARWLSAFRAVGIPWPWTAARV
jgi:7-cyano-7-deazaguanine synthase in queuosine biosynthesis